MCYSSTEVLRETGRLLPIACWRDVWPRAISNFVAACKTTGARMLFMDDLYMYGPQTTPLTETMPLSDYGQKPAARSAATLAHLNVSLLSRHASSDAHLERLRPELARATRAREQAVDAYARMERV